MHYIPELDTPARAERLRAALTGLMEVERVAWDAQGRIGLRGRLLADPQTIYGQIRRAFAPLGYLPLLRHSAGQDEVNAVPLGPPARPPRRLLPLALLLLTIISTTLTGAINALPLDSCAADFGVSLRQSFAQMWLVLTRPDLLAAGLPFSATLMSILLAHEMGHFVVGRLRGAPVSPPYFIPMPPFLSFTGTMGAVIVQREPMADRRTILEIGIAGPLAGMALAVPLLWVGLMQSTVGPPPQVPPGCGLLQEGNSLLYLGMKYLAFGQWLPQEGLDVALSPVALGAWIGLLVTMLNLLPLGQLDGGHVAYALLGDSSCFLSYAILGLCLILGLLLSQTWLFWGVLALLTGPRHPPPLNDIPPLRGGHVALALFGLLLFVLIAMPEPLRVVGG